MNLPETIHVGYKTYDVEKENVASSHSPYGFGFGHVSHVDGTITINEHVDEAEILNTTIHEILHCFEHVYSIEFGANEEDSHKNIDRLSSALSALFIDNPELLESIKSVS